jgi:gamma-glutamylcyclotransferase (GGCT)/AIG2-like uncharacterized protein YtfP
MPHTVDPRELAMGIKEEYEHTDDRRIAQRIALDHLGEDPRYYSKLKRCFDHTYHPRRNPFNKVDGWFSRPRSNPRRRGPRQARRTSVFCYGSNDPAQIEERLGGASQPEYYCAWLDGYKRVFRGWSRNWQCGVASLKKARSGRTYGFVATVTQEELRQLDRFEGVNSQQPRSRRGSYRREKVNVTDEAGDLQSVWVYVSNSNEFNRPSRTYLKAVARTIRYCWSGSSGSRVTWQDIPIR